MLNNLRGLLGFSKREMNGVLILIPLIVLILSVPTIYAHYFSPNYDNTTDQVLLDSLVQLIQTPDRIEETPKELFKFDPNRLPIDSLRLLGIPLFLSKRIDNFRNAGGRFKVDGDLKKIYDFPDSLFEVLKPFLSISNSGKMKEKTIITEAPLTTGLTSKAIETEQVLSSKAELPLLIDLNAADTTDIKQLKGIGSVYSQRMLKYRALLGGYVTINQVKEVYGITDSLFQRIAPFLTIRDSTLVQVQINLASFKEVNAHPYISYEQTQDLFNNKSKVGKYRNAADLIKLNSFDTSQVKRLLPYLDFR